MGADELDVEGCRRLAGAVIRSGLDLPDPARQRFLEGDGFRFWSEVAGADPARLRALIAWTEARPQAGPLVDTDD